MTHDHCREAMIIAFNKPYGVVSQFTPHTRHRVLAEFDFPPRVYPAGRLDHDSEGLLILTDEADVVARLLSESHPRTYCVQVEGIPDDAAIARLQLGLVIQHYRTRPCLASVLQPQPDIPERNPPIRFRKNIPTCWLEITLTEGKNRQIRRMTAAIGFPTLRLIRLRIGQYELKTLLSGQWKVLSEVERRLLFSNQ